MFSKIRDFCFKHLQCACFVDLTKYMQNKFAPPKTGMSYFVDRASCYDSW